MAATKQRQQAIRRGDRVSQFGPTTDHHQPELPPACAVRISISRMTDEELAQMSASDLVDLLAYSSLISQWADLLRELPSAGRNGLHRLALLARRRCRDEIESLHLRRGRPSPRYA